MIVVEGTEDAIESLRPGQIRLEVQIDEAGAGSEPVFPRVVETPRGIRVTQVLNQVRPLPPVDRVPIDGPSTIEGSAPTSAPQIAEEASP